MDALDLVERFFALLMASYEAEIATINYLGHHRCKPQLIDALRQMVKYSLKNLEEIEISFVQQVEEQIEQKLGENATAIKILSGVHKQEPDQPHVKEMLGYASRGHSELTAVLSQAETEVEKIIAEKFKIMKEEVHGLLLKIDRL